MTFKPHITEKSIDQLSNKEKYTFKFGKRVTKNKIKGIIERAFGVTVKDVKTANFAGKKRRRGKHFGETSGYKKAVVKLKKGDKINEFKQGLK